MKNRTIAENLHLINQSIKLFAKEAKRNTREIQLIAVSKFIETPRILEAYHAGQRIFGENRVQELVSKMANLPSDIAWHLIGHLQTNKVKAAVKSSQLIHSIDSTRLLKKVNEAAEIINKKQEILIQINISEEESKYGAFLDLGEELIMLAEDMRWVQCNGLMTITPELAGEEEVRAIFYKLRTFRDSIEQKLQRSLPELSMGMSGDYKIAIDEGATLVRIGTAIFGKRTLKKRQTVAESTAKAIKLDRVGKNENLGG